MCSISWFLFFVCLSAVLVQLENSLLISRPTIDGKGLLLLGICSAPTTLGETLYPVKHTVNTGHREFAVSTKGPPFFVALYRKQKVTVDLF